MGPAPIAALTNVQVRNRVKKATEVSTAVNNPAVHWHLGQGEQVPSVAHVLQNPSLLRRGDLKARILAIYQESGLLRLEYSEKMLVDCDKAMTFKLGQVRDSGRVLDPANDDLDLIHKAAF